MTPHPAESAGAVRTPRVVESEVSYLAPGSSINRRFVAPGAEHSTGEYRPYPVRIADARQAELSLARHGFALVNRPSSLPTCALDDKAEIEARYLPEVSELVKSATGAQEILILNWKARGAGQDTQQPPALEVHVDLTPECAEHMARERYTKAFPGRPAYQRFVAAGVWRAVTPPPQDFALALCDGASVEPEEGTPNTLVVVKELPDRATMLGAIPEQAHPIQASVFRHRAAHRWWYYSDMTPDEAVLFKFYDSERIGAWRVPHAAFLDPSCGPSVPRRSVEVRLFAYFLA